MVVDSDNEDLEMLRHVIEDTVKNGQSLKSLNISKKNSELLQVKTDSHVFREKNVTKSLTKLQPVSAIFRDFQGEFKQF